MNRVVVKSRVGPDGVLNVSIPVGAGEANREVQVTIDPAPLPVMTQDEWRSWVERHGGSVADPGFRRHEQGVFRE